MRLRISSKITTGTARLAARCLGRLLLVLLLLPKGDLTAITAITAITITITTATGSERDDVQKSCKHERMGLTFEEH